MDKNKRRITVFVHHEIGEKPQIGKDQKQSYLKLCIQQAQKYGNEVILFGDNVNKDWCNKWVSVKEIHSYKWKRFLDVFENYSTYPDAWAKGIFHRFFIFEQYIQEKNIDSFFVLDSDILLFSDLSGLNIWDDIDFAASIPESKQLGNDSVNSLRWTINAGVSYWTKKSISDFIEFCIETYTNKKEILMEKWYFHQAHHYPGGVCEMSLLYLWVSERNDLRIMNLVDTKIPGIMFNSDINGDEGLYKNEYKVSIALGIKKIYVNNHQVYLINTTGNKINVQNLHFGGAAKSLMKDIYNNEKIMPKTYFLHTLLNVRMKVGTFYRSIKRKTLNRYFK